MKKLLNSLYILDENAWLTLDGENIVCKYNDDDKKDAHRPFTNIEDIYCFSYLGCSPALMKKCSDYGIALNFFSPDGQFQARIQGKTKGNIFLRKAQFELFASPPPRLMQNTVASKLSNTRYLIRRSLHDNPNLDSDGEISDCINYLNHGIENAYEITDTESLMGLEGSCANNANNLRKLTKVLKSK